MKTKIFFAFLFLSSIFLGLFLRTQYKYEIWQNSDTAFHYSYFKNTDLNNRYELTSYENKFQPIMMYTFPDLLNIFLDKNKAFYYSPLITFILTQLILFLLLKREFGNRVAILTCFIIAVSFGNITKTIIGNFRADMYAPLLIISFIYFKKTWIKSLIMSFIVMMWNGYTYPIIIMILIALLTYNKTQTIELAISFSVFSFIAIKMNIIPYSIQQLLILQLIFLLFSISAFIPRKKLRAGALLLIITLGFIIFKNNILLNLKNVFQFIYPTETFYKWIAELQPTNAKTVLNYLYLTPVFALFGLPRIFKRKELAIYSLITLPTIFWTNRFLFLASIPLAIGTALFFNEFKSKTYIVVFALLVSANLIHTYALVNFINPSISKSWLNMFEYIENNTEEDSLFLTRWDIGSYVQAYSNRRTVTDSIISQLQTQIERRAAWLLSNRTLDYYGFEGVDYVILSVSDLARTNYYFDLIDEPSIEIRQVSANGFLYEPKFSDTNLINYIIEGDGTELELINKFGGVYLFEVQKKTTDILRRYQNVK